MMPEDTAPPTKKELEAVGAYLRNMLDFNDTFHDYAQDLVNICYYLQSAQGSVQSGLDTVEQILIETAIAAVAAMTALLAPPAGSALAAAFTWLTIGTSTAGGLFGGMASGLGRQTYGPASLDLEFADVWDRFHLQFLGTSRGLALLASDPVRNWSVTVTDPRGGTTAVSDLATMTFPEKSDQQFWVYLQSSLAAFTTTLWRQTLTESFRVVGVDSLVTNGPATIREHPGIYAAPGIFQTGLGMAIIQTGPFSEMGQGQMSDQAGTYLFIDDGFGTVMNPSGAAYRVDVFLRWFVGAGTKTNVAIQSLVPAAGQLATITSTAASGWAGGQLINSPLMGGSPVMKLPVADDTSVAVLARGADGSPLLGVAPAVAGPYSWDELQFDPKVTGGQPVAGPVAAPAVWVGQVFGAGGTNDADGPLLRYGYSYGGWHCDDLTTIAADARPISGIPAPWLVSYQPGQELQVSVLARSIDGHLVRYDGIDDLTAPAPSTSWTFTDLTAGGCPAIGDSPAVTPDGLACYAVGSPADGHANMLIECWPTGDGWTGGPPPVTASPIEGIPAIYEPTPGSLARQIFARGTDGHLIQFVRDVSGSWNSNDLTVLTGGNMFVYGNPVVPVGGGHVLVRGASGQLLDFFYTDFGTSGAWQVADLSPLLPCGTLTTGDPTVTGSAADGMTIWVPVLPPPPKAAD
jgi:hypothetical protein